MGRASEFNKTIVKKTTSAVKNSDNNPRSLLRSSYNNPKSLLRKSFQNEEEEEEKTRKLLKYVCPYFTETTDWGPKLCGLSFNSRESLRNHIKADHGVKKPNNILRNSDKSEEKGEVEVEETTKKRAKKPGTFLCPFYTVVGDKGPERCLQPLKSRDKLRDHLKTIHDEVLADPKDKLFKSTEAFDIWWGNEQDTICFSQVKTSSSAAKDVYPRTERFTCNYNGHPTTTIADPAERLIAPKDSYKMGAQCPMEMKVFITRKLVVENIPENPETPEKAEEKYDYEYKVTYHGTHCGHGQNPMACRHSKQFRNKLIEDFRAKTSKESTLQKYKQPGKMTKSSTVDNRTYNDTVRKERIANRALSGIYDDNDLHSCRLRFAYLNKVVPDDEEKWLFFANFDEPGQREALNIELSKIDEEEDEENGEETDEGDGSRKRQKCKEGDKKGKWKEVVKILKDSFIVLCDEKMMSNLVKYGSDYICMDSTFGVTSSIYNLKLTAILVINEFGQGVPVVYIISANLKTDTIRRALEMVKEKIGVQIRTNVFMTDNDNTYFNAWAKVMGRPPNKLLCTWHVERAWSKKILQYKRMISREERKKMLARLLDIKKCTCEKLFRKKLLQLKVDWMLSPRGTKKLKEVKRDMYSYLEKYYLKRVREWADCYRLGLVLTTNNYVESHFNYLKTVVFKRQHNHRLDVLVHKLLLRSNFDEEKYLKHEAAGKGFKDSKTHALHRKGLKNHTFEAVRRQKGGGWIFKQEMKDEHNEWTVHKYRIKMAECNDCKCLKKCRICGACDKIMECTCHDYAVSRHVCEHIHFIASVYPEVRDKITIKFNDFYLRNPEAVVKLSRATRGLEVDYKFEKPILINRLNECLNENYKSEKDEAAENKILRECVKKLEKLKLGKAVELVTKKRNAPEKQIRTYRGMN